jgi:2-dehydropantoate 2-reductase
MKVVIAGAGSVGLLIGSYLVESGLQVVFLVRREEQASLIRKLGIKRLNGDGSEVIFKAAAYTSIERLPDEAPWIVATKYGGVAPIVESLLERNVRNAVMFVQNGYGHFDFVNRTTLPNVFFATVEHGAGRLDDRTVSHNGIGLMNIAPFRGDENGFEFMNTVNSSKFPVAFANDAHQIVFRKVLINCMINPLTAILQMRNGDLVENRYAKELFDKLFNEIIAAFPDMKNELTRAAVEDVCVRTSKNRSSMLTDRMNGNPMEIETVVTSVIQMGERGGASMDLLRTLEKMLLAIDRS